MKVIIGLGNPGNKYLTTRHNIGFLFLDWLAQTQFDKKEFQNSKKLHAETLELDSNGQKLLLAKPTTFMNLSGDAFSKIKNFYKIEDKDFIIVYDDIDLDFSTVRYKEKGSAGTHNGMRSILQHADSQGVPRLRLGINNPIRQHKELSDFVLSNFSKDELQNLSKIFQEGLSKIDI